MNRRAFRVLAEMVVVFVGVYAAFALDEYRAQRNEEARRIQILEALEKDFSSNQATFDEAVPLVIAVVDSVLTDYEAGLQPTIGHLGVDLTFRSGAWDAMLAAGGVNILDIELIFAVEAFYESAQALFDAAAEGKRLSAALILPALGQDNADFYEPTGGKLKAKYRWYMSALRRYREGIQGLQQQNREILDTVQQQLAEH